MEYTIKLTHPLLGVPAVARVTDFFHGRDNGEISGLEVVFPDGHTAVLTFKEIAQLREVNKDGYTNS